MFLNSEDSAAGGSRKKLWLSYALIFALVTASTASLLLCPCDLPGRSPRAWPLIALSVIFGVTAAAFVYRLLQRYTGITVLLRALYAVAIVALAVYFEFDLAAVFIAWLARPGNLR
ncbi:MAG: hypothetical protein ACLPZY_11350 [Terracidiphilus sp.]